MDAGAPELGLEIRGDMERLVIEYVLAACDRQPGCIGTLWPSREIHPGPRWEHEIEKQGWPFWKRLMHRLQDCPICKPKSQTRKLQ